MLKKVFNLLLLAFPLASVACNGYVVGFGGLNGVFDAKAFTEYANKQGYCARSYAWQDQAKASVFIDTLTVPYQLYGFSKGAETVSIVLKAGVKKPEYILTVGAYRTVDVDFTKYGIPFENYFDGSGRGQKSPGIFLNRSHNQMQAAVNNLIGVTMSTHGDGGKGSAPRPIPDPQKFRDNWDQIFGRKPKAEDFPDKKKPKEDKK